MDQRLIGTLQSPLEANVQFGGVGVGPEMVKRGVPRFFREIEGVSGLLLYIELFLGDPSGKSPIRSSVIASEAGTEATLGIVLEAVG